MKAIVFAAGLGTRLRPLTLSRPKALVEVNGIAMLGRTIIRLREAGITEIVVNVHHFPQMIMEYLSANNNFGVKITVSLEEIQPLETGGAIAKAAPLLRDSEPFLACNADILTDLDINAMVRAHNDSGADVSLLAQQRVTSRYLYFTTPDMRLAGWQNVKTGETRPDGFVPAQQMKQCAFGGYHIISQKVLDLLATKPADVPFGIIPFYVSSTSVLDIRGYIPDTNYQWFDIGSIETLTKASENFKE